MSKKKINAKNIMVLTASNMALSASVGLSASYILEWPAMWTIAAVNMASLTPLLLASGDAIRKELGLDNPAKITGNWAKKSLGRSIPINAGDKQSNIFMSALQLTAGESAQPERIAQLETITVSYNDNSYTVTIPELETFIYSAWRRQGQAKPGLSRRYWTENRRPTITVTEYNIMIFILENVDGLIVNRSGSRSGKLTLPPVEALKMIRSIF